jgi:hypothetical protein
MKHVDRITAVSDVEDPKSAIVLADLDLHYTAPHGRHRPVMSRVLTSLGPVQLVARFSARLAREVSQAGQRIPEELQGLLSSRHRQLLRLSTPNSISALI